MKIDYEIIDNGILLKNIKNFNPKHIFECGQAFRWIKEEDNSYTTVAYKKVINVKLLENKNIIIDNTNEEDFNEIWVDYFDLNRDYSLIQKKLGTDKTMKEAIKYGSGIRILNQEPFETIISFITSANNQIPRIKKSINIIAQNYGEFISNYRGNDYYSFPSANQLSKISSEELKEVARVGFRDKRINETSNLINNEEFSIDVAKLMDTPDLRNYLMELPGVGPKVSDCIMLFSFKRGETFPVDVWIKRVMEELYLHEETKQKDISKKAGEIFGEYAGFAQQYLFYYGRENNIGKKNKDN